MSIIAVCKLKKLKYMLDEDNWLWMNITPDDKRIPNIGSYCIIRLILHDPPSIMSLTLKRCFKLKELSN